MSRPPPLGELTGMSWDPIRQKYFLTPKEPIIPNRSLVPPRTQLRAERDIPTASGSGSGYVVDNAKRRRLGEIGKDTGGRYRRKVVGGYGSQDRGMLSAEEHLAGLSYEGSDYGCGCRSERISTLQTFLGGAYLAATDGGKIMMQDLDETKTQIAICSESIVGLHFDIARMSIIGIAGGASPHLHIFRRNEDLIDDLTVSTVDLETLAQKDIQCVATYDDTCVLGTHKTLTSITGYEKPLMVSRRFPSDPLSMDFGDNPHLIYSGLRNSSVILTDLRTPAVLGNAICRVPGRKAVVGVKRLDDAAVPYGLVASAMGSELLIYDTRFGRSPLHTLPDHVNTYHASLGLATTPDSKFLFAAGSDRRIGLWSTITGERIHPIPSEDGLVKESPNPLRRLFSHMVQNLAVREDYGLSVGCGGEVMHFGKPGGGSKSRWDEEGSEVGHEGSDGHEGDEDILM